MEASLSFSISSDSDDVLKRAMFVEGGDHFIFMKQIDILSHEQLSLLRALERRKKSTCEGEEN